MFTLIGFFLVNSYNNYEIPHFDQGSANEREIPRMLRLPRKKCA